MLTLFILCLLIIMLHRLCYLYSTAKVQKNQIKRTLAYIFIFDKYIKPKLRLKKQGKTLNYTLNHFILNKNIRYCISIHNG